MIQNELQDLVDLSEAEATRVYLDRRNLRRLSAAAVLFAIVSFGEMIALLASATREPTLAVLAAANGVLNSAIFVFRRRPTLAAAIDRYLLIYLAVQLAVLVGPAEDEGSVIMLAGVLFPGLLIGLRLRPMEVAAIAAVLPAAGWFVLARLTSSAQGNGPGGPTVAIGVLAAMAAGISLWRTRVVHRGFLAEWGAAAMEARERSRMRSELAFAREIQLGMLPSAPPALDWIEVSARSDPAAEVGGDYYDWFVLSPTRVALVVGDVAGHGVASGLVLAGVRSCLYLLRRELASPGEVASRLDEVVRDTGARRMFMALLLVVIDRERLEAQVVSAGHPLPLRRRAASSVVESLGSPSPPLGTRLGSRFVCESVPLAPGDELLLVSDGVLESQDARGEVFGETRVVESFATDAGAAPAEICQQLFADLRDFRGGRAADDDCTILVAKLIAGGSNTP